MGNKRAAVNVSSLLRRFCPAASGTNSCHLQYTHTCKQRWFYLLRSCCAGSIALALLDEQRQQHTTALPPAAAARKSALRTDQLPPRAVTGCTNRCDLNTCTAVTAAHGRPFGHSRSGGEAAPQMRLGVRPAPATARRAAT